MQVRPATAADDRQISVLLRSLSEAFFLLPGGQGAEHLLQFIGDSAVQGYVTAGNFRYQVLEAEGQVVGVVAVRGHSHLYHLFVAPAYQGRGLARQLRLAAKDQAVQAGNAGRSTVNSSLGAVPVYERFGFVATERPVVKHGISFQPMALGENGG